MVNSFRTEITLNKTDFPKISYASKVMLIGSCFSDNIGEQFSYHKFPHKSNPFGVTYNPSSLERHLKRISDRDLFKKEDLIEKGEFYNSFELHGSFDNKDSGELLKIVNEEVKDSHEFLKTCSHLFITLGTAWVYELKESGNIVNNCHKIPSTKFNKKLLTPDEVQVACLNMVDIVRKINPKARIIFTVSPVRHLKDGFTENNLSKSILIQSIHSILENNDLSYFPSYEIMMDDLRDYRFYAKDMLHPNELAIEYIWNQLVQNFMDEDTKGTMESINKIQQSINHKAFNPKSDAHQTFLKNTMEEIENLMRLNSHIDMYEELNLLRDQLTE